MSPQLIVYRIREHQRSKVICDAMIAGLRRIGEKVTQRFEDEYRGVEGDVAIFYGLEGNLPKIFDAYRAHGTVAYVDLGYWGRRDGGRWAGYHKVVINARHPTTYFQSVRHRDDRARALGITALPWRTSGKHILLAGMGAKGAQADGFEPEQWERDAIAQIRAHTRHDIVYRPKPSWKSARPIQGVGYSPRTQELSDVMRNVHAVVTHHSNVAVDGLVAGIPSFSWAGVAAPLSSQDLSQIAAPVRPEGREQWIADIAYTQWSVAEMAEGRPWVHLKSEGLVP